MNMTIDTLQAEAEKLGYILVKKQAGFGRLKKCTCGRYPHRVVGDGEFKMFEPGWCRDAYYIKCYTCGKQGPTARRCENYEYETLHETESRARNMWNEMIEEGE